MHVTLDQARALDALDRHGSFSAAARALGKGHSALLYALDQLEAQTELELADRSGYRTRLTPAGQRLVEQCRRLLAAERELHDLCAQLKSGWEPSLKVVFDGVVAATPILRAAGQVAEAAGGITRLDVQAEYLGGVEATFLRDEADLMITVLAPETRGLSSRPLVPLRMWLCAPARHPLVTASRRPDAAALAAHVLVTVRGSDPRLALPTAAIEPRATVRLNDFAAKQAALLAGVGYGWLPEQLAAVPLARGQLRRVRWRGASTHTLRPRLYWRADRPLGRGASRFADAL